MANKTIIEAEITSNVGDVTKDVDKLDKSTKEASGGFKGMGKSIRGIGTALKAAGIGLIVGLFAKLAEVFTQNQKVVDTFNTAMEFLSITFNDFFKFIQNNLNTATGFFDKIFGNTAVKQVLEFGKTLGIEVITRVKNLIQGIGGLGKALMQVFKGDFKEALETSKESLLNFTGNTAETIMMEHQIVKITDKIKDYTKANLDSAKALVDVRKQSELARVQVQGLIEEFDRQAEKLRQVRDDESKTFQERIDANNELLDYQQANEQEQIKTEKSLATAKVAAVQGALGNIASIVGENSKFGKAIAVTQAIIDTYVGANKALAQGGIFGFIGAAAVIASGIANVKTITSKKPPPAPSFAKGGSGRGASAPSTPSAPPPPVLPDINTVGASGINQLADAIGGQSQQPVQAFVVSNDVTTAQGLERNIIDGASI